MKAWARTLESLEKTKGTSSKVELVTSYLRSGDPEELDLKARFLSGQASFPGSPDPLNVDWSLILEALSEIEHLISISGSIPSRMKNGVCSKGSGRTRRSRK